MSIEHGEPKTYFAPDEPVSGGDATIDQDKESQEWIENLPPHQSEKIGNKDFYRVALGDRLYLESSRELSGNEVEDGIKTGIDLFKELLKGVALKDLIKKDDLYGTIFKHRAGNISVVRGKTIEDGIEKCFEFYTEDQEKSRANKETGEIERVIIPVSDEVKQKHSQIKELALRKAKEIEEELGEDKE